MKEEKGRYTYHALQANGECIVGLFVEKARQQTEHCVWIVIGVITVIRVMKSGNFILNYLSTSEC